MLGLGLTQVPLPIAGIVDRAADALPQAWVLSLSLWVWRAVMLLWALWLAHRLVRWLQWGWQRFSSAGVWKPRRNIVTSKG